MFYTLKNFLIKFHPHITASLFAINSFLLSLVIIIVGPNPSIPGIAETVISTFFKFKIIKIIQKFYSFLNLSFILLSIFSFLIIKYSGLYFFIWLQISE